MKIERVKNIEFFESLSNQFQITHRLNPLAADIFAYLALDVKNDGITFKELTDSLGVSKSSVSTSINLLLQLELIESTTNKGSRRRYFKVNRDNYISVRLKNSLDYYIKEKEVSKKYIAFLSESDIEKKRIDKTNIYREYLQEVASVIEKTIQKLKDLEN